MQSGMVRVDRRKRIIPMTTPSQFGAATFAQGAITEHLQTGELPLQDSVNDAFGYASGALRFDLELPAHATEEVYLAIPFGTVEQDQPAEQESLLSGAEQFSSAVRQWEDKLGTFDIRLPPVAPGVVETLKTAAAHILINRAGAGFASGPAPLLALLDSRRCPDGGGFGAGGAARGGTRFHPLVLRLSGTGRQPARLRR